MYTSYWNLKAIPFLNVVDPRFFFTGDQHEEAVARFTFLAESGRLAGVLTGPYGAGKSTVLKRIAAAAQLKDLPVICMDAIPGGQLPMAQLILEEMKIEGTASSLPDALMCFWRAANARPCRLTRTLLCIDEAHYLVPDNGLYLIHYLTNLRIPDPQTQTEGPLFTVIMAGAPQLVPALQAEPSLCQRIQITFSLSPLSADQTTAYIQHHMKAVGGDIWVFQQDALDAIYRYSAGLPRKINLLCDTSLMLGFASQAPSINAAIVSQAAVDTGLTTLHKSAIPTPRDAEPAPRPAPPRPESPANAAYAPAPYPSYPPPPPQPPPAPMNLPPQIQPLYIPQPPPSPYPPQAYPPPPAAPYPPYPMQQPSSPYPPARP